MNAPRKPTTHVCLVSEQVTPNLTPVLDPATAPRRVRLVVSPDMTGRAAWLSQVLAPRGIRVEQWTVSDPWDVEQVQLRTLELLEAERDAVAGGAIALNVTGGTKPMAIAAYEAFRAYDLPIFYVHPRHDRLIWMHPADRPAVDLANRVGLDDFLAAHGSRVLRRADDAVPPPLGQLTDWLVAQNVRIERSLATLNWLAHGAERDLRSPRLEPHQLRDAGLSELIGHFADQGLVQIDGERLRFPDEAARFFVNGGWLEAHAYDLLRRLRGELGQIQDLARSVDIARANERGDPVPNELDVACLAENRLYIIECKTRRWGDGAAFGPGADALYRLDALADLLGGLQAQAMLVSYRALPANVQERAANLRIHTCAGARLPELPTILRQWIAPTP